MTSECEIPPGKSCERDVLATTSNDTIVSAIRTTLLLVSLLVVQEESKQGTTLLWITLEPQRDDPNDAGAVGPRMDEKVRKCAERAWCPCHHGAKSVPNPPTTGSLVGNQQSESAQNMQNLHSPPTTTVFSKSEHVALISAQK